MRVVERQAGMWRNRVGGKVRNELAIERRWAVGHADSHTVFCIECAVLIFVWRRGLIVEAIRQHTRAVDCHQGVVVHKHNAFDEIGHPLLGSIRIWQTAVNLIQSVRNASRTRLYQRIVDTIGRRW